MGPPEIAIYEALADLYEVLHDRRGDELLFYRSQVRSAGTAALDVACGTGVIAAELAAVGARVTGIDASPSMLARARERLPDACWIEADMRDFDAAGPFGLATCACNSLQHLHRDSDLAAALETICRHLDVGGIFAFDVFNPAPEFLAQPRRDVPMRRLALEGGSATLVEDTTFDRHSGLLHIDWRIVRDSDGGVLRRSSATMRQIFPDDLDARLEAAGFEVISRNGDFGGGPFTDGAAKQVVVAARAS